MKKRIIRLGDPTDHGGQVISVSATHYTVDDIPVARVGDKCSCPHKGHDNCVIVEGDPEHTIDGIPVAYEGHATSCGAKLQSTATNFDKG
ncbi:MAG: PAAR domain-containing protein [Aquabacterium sp.]